MSPDIFLSYSRGDREFVASIARRLDERGLTAWYDARIDGGPDWSEAVADAINSAGFMVVFYAEESNRSRQMQREVAYAVRLDKPVVPILIENTVPRGGLLLSLARRTWVSAAADPRGQSGDIVNLLAHLAGKPLSAPAPSPQPASLAEREQTIDAALGGMIRDAVGADRPPPRDLGAYANPRDAHGHPVLPLSNAALTALNVVSVGAYGLLARRRAIRSFRSNIRKL